MTPSPRLTALKDILARVEMAGGPDGEIDATLYEIFGIDEDHCRLWRSMDGREGITRAMFVSAWAPRYTSSLDACINLAELVLLGKGLSLLAESCARLMHANIVAGTDVDAWVLPLAFLAAILTALIAIEEKGRA